MSCLRGELVLWFRWAKGTEEVLVELRIEVTANHYPVAVRDGINCELKLADGCVAAGVLQVIRFCGMGDVDVDYRELAVRQHNGDDEVRWVLGASRGASFTGARADKDACAMVLGSAMVVQLPAVSRQSLDG